MNSGAGDGGQARRRKLEIVLATVLAIVVTGVVDAIVWTEHPYLAIPLLVMVFAGQMVVFDVLAKKSKHELSELSE